MVATVSSWSPNGGALWGICLEEDGYCLMDTRAVAAAFYRPELLPLPPPLFLFEYAARFSELSAINLVHWNALHV